MTKIIINLVLLYIIYILISQIYNKCYNISENFKTSEDIIDPDTQSLYQMTSDQPSSDMRSLYQMTSDPASLDMLRSLPLFKKNNQVDKDWLEDLFEYRQIITIPERVNHVKKFCKSFNIKKTIFNAILKKDISYNNVYNLKLGEIACAISQETVLKNFINGNYKSMILFEDDNMPLNNKFYIDVGLNFDYIKEYITNSVISLPYDWDILYLGRCWDDCMNNIPINKYIVKTKKTLCHHAIAFSRKGASIVLENISHPLNLPIDHIVANLTLYGKLNTYATILPIFYQNRDELNSTIGNFDHLPICI